VKSDLDIQPDAPPISFDGTHPSLRHALLERGYREPTPVQAAVLRPDAAERDLLVSAQTGSGKTVAYGLALATTLLGEAERFQRPAEPLALIVAPTRELALQVQRELIWLYGPAGARVASCVGGMDIRREARALADGCHLVVGTPGRLRDHIERGRLDVSQLKAVVLDEADEMLDLGFREDLEFILDATPPERRTLLFSATIPRDIASLARRFQRNALRIDTVDQSQPHGDIEYRAVRIAPSEIEHAVVNVLRFFEMRGAMVFCHTREAVRISTQACSNVALPRSRFRVSSRSRSEPMRCRHCGTGARGSASRPTSRHAASTSPIWASSFTPISPATARRCSTAAGERAARDEKASASSWSPIRAGDAPRDCWRRRALMRAGVRRGPGSARAAFSRRDRNRTGAPLPSAVARAGGPFRGRFAASR
jgi:hypothetical protein